MKAKKLSGGYKRKLNVALSVINDPEVLILDEPTANIDVPTRVELWKTLRKMKNASSGFAWVLCTHDLSEAERLGDDVSVLNWGEIIFSGSVGDLKTQFGARYEISIKPTNSQNQNINSQNQQQKIQNLQNLRKMVENDLGGFLKSGSLQQKQSKLVFSVNCDISQIRGKLEQYRNQGWGWDLVINTSTMQSAFLNLEKQFHFQQEEIEQQVRQIFDNLYQKEANAPEKFKTRNGFAKILLVVYAKFLYFFSDVFKCLFLAILLLCFLTFVVLWKFHKQIFK